MDDFIWLHPEADSDGVVVIKDQHGRRLKGIRSIEFRSDYREPNEMTLTVLSGINAPMLNNKRAT